MFQLSSLRRHWFPVCRARELGQRPLKRALLGEAIVLFRTAEGHPAALRDRCAHRNAPLSAGWVSDGSLVCPYHGWRFDHAGVCQGVPGRCGVAAHPSRSVPAYRSVEQGGLVWVRLDAEGERGLPETQPRSRGDAVAMGEFTLTASLIDGLENFLDPTHTHFVHTGVVRDGASRRRVTAMVRGESDRVEAEYIGEGRQSGLVSRLFGAGIDASVGRFILPATAELEYLAAGKSRLLIRLFFSPVSERELKVFAVASGSLAPLPAWMVVHPLRAMLQFVARQDQRILALQLANVERFGSEQFSSTELDIMRPHILRLLRTDAAGEPAKPFEQQVDLLL